MDWAEAGRGAIVVALVWAETETERRRSVGQECRGIGLGSCRETLARSQRAHDQNHRSASASDWRCGGWPMAERCRFKDGEAVVAPRLALQARK